MFPFSLTDRHDDRAGRWGRCALFVLVGFAPTTALAAASPEVAASMPMNSIACGDAQMTKQTDGTTVVHRTSGAGDAATVITRGPNGEITLEQSGPCNDAEIAQGGSDNLSTVRQHGSGNRVVVRQGPPRGEAQ